MRRILRGHAFPAITGDDQECVAAEGSLMWQFAIGQSEPLGAKAAGEAGTVGGLSTVMNAVLSALAPLGVPEIGIPATPERVWRAVREAT